MKIIQVPTDWQWVAESDPKVIAAQIDELEKALRNMLAHMFGPDHTGMTRAQIETQARDALK